MVILMNLARFDSYSGQRSDCWHNSPGWQLVKEVVRWKVLDSTSRWLYQTLNWWLGQVCVLCWEICACGECRVYTGVRGCVCLGLLCVLVVLLCRWFDFCLGIVLCVCVLICIWFVLENFCCFCVDFWVVLRNFVFLCVACATELVLRVVWVANQPSKNYGSWTKQSTIC